MLKTQDIRIRDPYVVTYNGMYYMYGTIGEDRGEKNLYVFRSTNLSDWEEGKVIFTLSEDSWGLQELWAPEVHIYKGKYYIFVSILGKHGLRGTQIAVSDTPDGMFIPITNKPCTPMDSSCIDGSLYVEDGTPYVVYSYDWPDRYDAEKDLYIGEICAAQLTEDLKEIVGEPFRLFTSLDAPCSAVAPAIHGWQGKSIARYGSDAPFIQKMEDGSLYLTWSPIPNLNYIVGAAVSKSGKIRGNWEHIEKPIYDNNGGHAMFFTDLEGNRKMCIHQPERYPDERALFLDVAEEDNLIKVL